MCVLSVSGEILTKIKSIVFQKTRYSHTSMPKRMHEYRIHTINGRIVPLNRRAVGTKKEIRIWAKMKKIPMKSIKIYERKEPIGWTSQDKPRSVHKRKR